MARVGALEQVFREQLDEVVTGSQGDLARGMEGWGLPGCVQGEGTTPWMAAASKGLTLSQGRRLS